MCLAARVSKYGIGIDEAIWQLPLAVLQQLLLFDDIVAGHRPRWADNKERIRDLDALLADALTAPLKA